MKKVLLVAAFFYVAITSCSKVYPVEESSMVRRYNPLMKFIYIQTEVSPTGFAALGSYDGHPDHLSEEYKTLIWPISDIGIVEPGDSVYLFIDKTNKNDWHVWRFGNIEETLPGKIIAVRFTR